MVCICYGFVVWAPLLYAIFWNVCVAVADMYEVDLLCFLLWLCVQNHCS